MGLRIITGVIDVKGFPQPGSVEITYNPLTVVATDQADVVDLRAYGDAGYYANKPSVLMSVNNLSIEDLIDPSGNIHNRIYRLETSYTTDPENIFQRVIYHRATMRWDYGPTGDQWCQGRVDKISFMVTGDAVPLEEAPLQGLPPGSFGFYLVKKDLYLTLEEYQILGNKRIVITNKLASKKEIELAIDNLVKNLEKIKGKAKEQIARIKDK